MKRLNTCLHIMYLLLVAVGIGFMIYERMLLGWFFWAVGFCVWCALFNVELKSMDNDRSVSN